MATTGYMSGRKQFVRPQAMLWSDTPGTISNGVYVPSGYEANSNLTGITSTDKFIILSDHNRGEISISPQRIEQRRRMANGTMRSYHIADKLNMSVSWTNLPSRSYTNYANFNQTTGKATYYNGNGVNDAIDWNTPGVQMIPADQEFTVDGGAGGVEMLDWYENHTGPFWVFLSYDKYNNFGTDDAAHLHLAQYSQIVQMYVSGFNYNVVKRGGTNMDLWNVSVQLEEV